MTPALYQNFRAKVIAAGFARDIEWSETVKPPATAEDFALEAIYVICNSGMKWKIARVIYDRVRGAILAGCSASTEFGHKGKAAAIDKIWADRAGLFDRWQRTANPLDFLEGLPWIGAITKYHLAKNFGVDCAKPDRHLVRIADQHQTTPEALCKRLSEASGDRVATVDYVLWRAAERGWLSYSEPLPLDQRARER